MLKPFLLFKSWLLVTLFLLLGVQFLCAQEDLLIHFFDSKFNLAFSYPDYYIQRSDPSLEEISSQVPLIIAAKHKTQKTSFNIIAISGEYDLSLPEKRQSEMLLNSYKISGLTDAVIKESGIVNIADKTFFCAEIHYLSQGTSTISYVSIIPAKGVHFILTFVTSEANNTTTLKNDTKQILKSLALTSDTTKGQARSAEKNSFIITPTILTFLKVLLCLLLLFTFIKIRPKSPR